MKFKIDLDKFAKIIAAMNDLENSVENQEYHELLGILSGNRTCLENITLEQLAYYIENLESIVRSPNWASCYHLQFSELVQQKSNLRRGI